MIALRLWLFNFMRSSCNALTSRGLSENNSSFSYPKNEFHEGVLQVAEQHETRHKHFVFIIAYAKWIKKIDICQNILLFWIFECGWGCRRLWGCPEGHNTNMKPYYSKLHMHMDRKQRFGSGSTLILASDPDLVPLRFLFRDPDQDPDPAKCSGSGWIRVEPKLCREKSKTATTSTNLPSRLHYFFNFFVWNRVNIHYLPT